MNCPRQLFARNSIFSLYKEKEKLKRPSTKNNEIALFRYLSINTFVKCQNVLNNFHAQHYAINTTNFVKLVHILSPISCNSKTVSKLEIHFKRLWNN